MSGFLVCYYQFMTLKYCLKYYVAVLKKYSDFKGRSSRAEYWNYYLVNSVIGLTISFIEGSGSLRTDMTAGPVESIYTLLVLLPSIAVAVRRMHDVNKSGWFTLVPIYNLILLVSKGDDKSNRFGAKPKNLH